jgi:FMN phosphatase YigB (HAD superfamily)
VSAAPGHRRAVELVVLDLDGTLYDARPLRRRMAVELLTAVATRRLAPRSLAALRAFRRHREALAEAGADGVRDRQYREAAAQAGVSEDELRALVARWMHERPLRHLRACRAAGIDAWLADLRERGVATSVLSDHLVGRKLTALGLAVDLEASAEDPEVDRFKPHPAGLEHLLARADVDPDRTLVVGDRPERDGAAAAAIGAAFLRKVWRRPEGAHEVRDFATLVGSVGSDAGARP